MDLETEIAYELALQRSLEKEIGSVEMYSDRVIIRKEINECKRKLKLLYMKEEVKEI
jgi:hypothetical protein